ncbi:MAG: hypothetical protein ACK54V_01450, partial [Candidatus Kapaibacterium sp.]
EKQSTVGKHKRHSRTMGTGMSPAVHTDSSATEALMMSSEVAACRPLMAQYSTLSSNRRRTASRACERAYGTKWKRAIKSERAYSHSQTHPLRTERRILIDGSLNDGVLQTTAQILLRKLMDGSECTALHVEMGGLSIAAPEQISFVQERVSPYRIAQTVEQRYPRTMHKVQMKNPDAYLSEQQWMLVPYTPAS